MIVRRPYPIPKISTTLQELEGFTCATALDLNKAVVDRELKIMEAKLEKYNVDQLGVIPIEREDGTMRIMVCQMGGCAGKEVREIKMSIMERLIQKYDVNLVACMELNFNWSKVNSSANLASWLHQEERETRSITAHNTQEQDAVSSKHQPGGTGMICHSKFIQYARKASADPRGLGRWCSWQFFCKQPKQVKTPEAKVVQNLAKTVRAGFNRRHKISTSLLKLLNSLQQ